MESILFELTKTFKYAAKSGGGQEECTHIELTEPTGKVSHVCCAIEGMIQTGVLNMSELISSDVIAQAQDAAQEAKKEPVDNEAEQDGDGDGALALMVGGGVDMRKLVLHFRELFKEVALMNGEEQKPLTMPRMDDMSHKDFRRMIGVYAANFILN